MPSDELTLDEDSFIGYAEQEKCEGNIKSQEIRSEGKESLQYEYEVETDIINNRLQ